MKLSVHVLTCTAILGTAALLSAQPTQPPQQTPPPTQQTTPQTATPAPAPQSTANKITVTGCLRSASSEPDMTATAGTAGTAGTSATGTTGTATDPSQQKFVLMDATRGTADPANATTAEPDVTSQTPKKDTYRLIANPTALAQHVGKKLELVGTLENANASSSDTSSGPFEGRPTLRVESGKIVGNSCDQK